MRQTIHKLTNDKVVLRIIELLKIQGKTEKELISSLGLANGTFTNWKYKDSKSYEKYLKKIAEYLDVSIDYLMEGVDDILNVQNLTASEISLLKMYRIMGKNEKDILLKSAELYVEAVENRK